jgi:hypothetical protein
MLDYKLRYPGADTVKARKDGKPYANGAKEKAFVLCANADCLSRECFWLFYDKGPYTPGLGYRSYYKKPTLVCGTQHLYGCPETRGIILKEEENEHRKRT